MPIMRNLEPPPTLRDMALQAIKDAVLSNKLKPGNFYNERNLANELGISKTPIREALLDLSMRGFITIFPRRGFQVNTLTEKNIQDLFEFRMALEKAVILHIAPNISNESITKIEVINKKAADSLGQMGFLRYDREMHRYLASLTRNQYIISALENVRDLIEWAGAKVLSIKGRSEEALQEHIVITKMLKKRDVAGAVKEMEEHLRITETRVLSQVTSEK